MSARCVCRALTSIVEIIAKILKTFESHSIAQQLEKLDERSRRLHIILHFLFGRLASTTQQHAHFSVFY